MTEHDPEESDALFNFVAWLDANRLTAIVVAGVALIGGFYFYISQFNADQLVGEAGATLEQANIDSRELRSLSTNSYKSVIREYPDSSASRRARLILARGLLDAVDYEGAQKQFDEFLAKNPKSPMAPGAELGSALCLDELNKTDEAKAKYDQIIKDHPGELVAQYAMINLAALQQEDGQLESAQELYKKLIPGPSSEGDLTFFEQRGPMSFMFRQMGSQRLASDMATSLERLLIKKNPQLGPKTPNPHIPPTIIPTETESNATKLHDNNGIAPESNATTVLPKDANATKPKSTKEGSTSKGKTEPEKPKKTAK